MFSDQQLLTGLGVLTAGYVQVVNASLSAYHWNSVVYLAWLSSTVHLMSLSVLRERLKRSKISLATRLCAILLVFVLLVAALWPAAMFPEKPAMPVRCLWKVRAYNTSEVSYFINTPVSYFTLVGTFVWKLSQFSDRTRRWMRYWGRTLMEYALEKAARQLLQTKHPTLWTKTSHRALTTLYIVFVAHLELLESFMFTITLLTYTLVWGTLHLVIRDKDTHDSHNCSSEVDKAEKAMGLVKSSRCCCWLSQYLRHWTLWNVQLTPRRKVAWPSTATDISSGQQKLPVLAGIALPTSVLQDSSVAKSRTLSKLLASRNVRLLTVAEKVTGDFQDPVIDHMYRSRTIKGFIILLHLSLVTGLVFFIGFGGAAGWKNSGFYLMVCIGPSLYCPRRIYLL